MADEKEQNEPNLMFERKFAFDIWDDATTKKAFEFCEGYKDFLSKAKTERLAVKLAEAEAVKNGFKRLEHIGEINQKGFNAPVYSVNRGKAIILAKPGKRPVKDGVRMVLAHIDSPHIDLKVRPLYENEHIAYFKTQYYHGIRKYQWTVLPLAMYGTIAKQDGTTVEIAIGDKESDNVFMITDIAPHINYKFTEKKVSEAVLAETMNIVAGSFASKGKEMEKDLVKRNILSLLNEKFGIKEEDFTSADLELVPQGKARDLGFDRSMIAAYGHDDRSCSFGAINALFEAEVAEYASVVVLVDKEEIGTEGATSAKSNFIIDFVSELLYLQDGIHDENILRDTLSLSKAISADVTSAYDPDYAESYDTLNAARLGAGIAVEKFLGAAGKAGSNEATAEYTAFIRRVYNEADINWQTGGIGKVDEGGANTIAKYLSQHNIDVIDSGVPVLSMHAPFEIVSKADIYSAYLAYKAFLEAK
jgi:aspartyl aminopeptidase